MMKRVGLSRFSPLEVSRKVQQCLRFEGVNANGVSSTENINANHAHNDADSETHTTSEKNCDDNHNKSNILTTIKKKWKKTKRNKRCDTRPRSESMSNVCQCHRENCESQATCAHHFRSRKPKQSDKSNIWPVPSSILRCQNHQLSDSKTDDVAELLPCSSDEPEICSCFGKNQKLNSECEEDLSTPSCSNFNPCSSCMSNLSCDANHVASSLAVNIESKGKLTDRISPTNSQDASSYASQICSIVDNVQSGSANMNISSLTPRVGNLTQELYKLSKYGWYWGPINRSEAELKLIDQPDGAFLVRDSSDDRYILSLSFRSHSKTLHTRIEHSNGLFSFYAQPEPEGHASIVELILQSMCFSQSGVFCYSRSRSPGSPSFPVRLTKPISRFTQVRSLQYLCRFVIRQYTRYDHIQKLPLPPRIKGYLEEGHY